METFDVTQCYPCQPSHIRAKMRACNVVCLLILAIFLSNGASTLNTITYSSDLREDFNITDLRET